MIFRSSGAGVLLMVAVPVVVRLHRLGVPGFFPAAVVVFIRKKKQKELSSLRWLCHGQVAAEGRTKNADPADVKICWVF
jgi:hypothetical protein